MISLLRVYEALGHIFWELEVADPDREGQLTRVTKGSFERLDRNDEDVAVAALQHAWKNSRRPANNRRGSF